MIQRVGDDASPSEITAAAGEDLELECIATGANPPAKLKWFMGNEEIASGHSQENKRPTENSRTWISLSRLVLPVSRDDNGATVRCEAEHPALEVKVTLNTESKLIIHCKLTYNFIWHYCLSLISFFIFNDTIPMVTNSS